MNDNIVHIPVNMDYAKRGDPTTLAFLRQSAERRQCKYGDPTCPCQDGDMCHYEGPNAWPPPPQLQKEAVSASQTERTCEDSESSG